ncbi:MAG: hypothetical protein MR033_06540 [Clostridiales bacterium]|nr:hypothetical protein [Clostridiales bacterium]
MKHKRIGHGLLCLCLCAALALSGCRLAREDGQEQTKERLIGVLITAEYLDLFDVDAYFQDNFRLQGGEIQVDGDLSAYQGRLYAELTERQLTREETGEVTTKQEYVFPDTEGLLCIVPRMTPEGEDSYLSTMADDAVETKLNLSYTDDCDCISMDATVYMMASGLPDEIHGAAYVNPVYQSADGSVYAVSGHGVSFSAPMGVGAVYTQTLSERTESIVDGERRAEETSIAVHLGCMARPERITVRQMDGQSRCLVRADYEPGTLPEMLVPQDGTEYVLVETVSSGENGEPGVSREIYEAQDDLFYTYYAREDGFLVRRSTQLLWPEASPE